MKSKILAAFLLEHPDMEVLGIKFRDYKAIVPAVSTALHEDIINISEEVLVKQDEDFILLVEASL